MSDDERGVRAVIAEDEPVLAAALERMLRKAWPELEIARIAHDGEAALRAIVELQPDVAFLDIRMPGLNGLEVAAQLADRGDRAPDLVFVTAYDEYAIEAFDAAAIDYLLKPVGDERLARCVARLQGRIAGRAADRAMDRRVGPGPDGGGTNPVARSGDGKALQALLAQLQQRLGVANPAPARLRFLRASLGDVTRQIAVDEVLFFEARDKYVAVTTRDSTVLVRLSLSELIEGLDPERFAQIHRSTIVRLDAIDTSRRDLTGRTWVHLRGELSGRELRLPVSRQFAGRFRGM